MFHCLVLAKTVVTIEMFLTKFTDRLLEVPHMRIEMISQIVLPVKNFVADVTLVERLVRHLEMFLQFELVQK